MQQGQHTTVAAIASRDLGKGAGSGSRTRHSQAYGSYEELLADPEIDAIYNPLPNQLHVPWTIKAAEAGKHVLCEKPLSLTVAEAETLLAVRARTGVKIGEAFMIRTHPQWLRAARAAGRGPHRRTALGRRVLQLLQQRSREHPQPHGRGRRRADGHWLLPHPRVALRIRAGADARGGLIDRDPADAHRPAHVGDPRFPAGQAIFTCSTQLVPYQRIHFFGTKGRIEMEIPFNAPPDRPTRLFIDIGGDLFGGGIATETFPVCDQYTLQGDAFSKAVLENTEVPVSIEDAIGTWQ